MEMFYLRGMNFNMGREYIKTNP